MPCPQGTAICFTINNPSEEEMTSIQSSLPCGLRYLVWQLEMGESGTPHIQGYAESSKKMSFAAWKKLISARMHCEWRKGTSQQASDYCKKPEGRLQGPYELGTPGRGAGQRTDLELIATMAAEGKSVRDLFEYSPTYALMHLDRFEKLRRAMATRRNLRSDEVEAHIFWGPTGTGKSHAAITRWPGAYWLKIPSKGEKCWWDNYNGEETVVLDEMTGQIPYRTLLSWCDIYPCMVEVKGGMVQLLAKRWVFTSPMPWHLWYTDMGSCSELSRRLTASPLSTMNHLAVRAMAAPLPAAVDAPDAVDFFQLETMGDTWMNALPNAVETFMVPL